jgi:organic hydroperoxide reductase OsmC/OhrA
MSEHEANISWINTGSDFLKGKYSREHTWAFDGGFSMSASPSPSVVPVPFSNPAHVDPEEAFVASISSCHMLFFLSIAANRGYVVDDYVDNASGVMEKRADGKMAMTRVVLRPRAIYSGATIPGSEEVGKMHHRAHDLCFIANSVNTAIETEIVG